MISLVFPLAGVLLLAEHALAASSHAASMREVLDGTPARPALWLVGDHGVFLMSNGLLTPADAEDTLGLPVVHAAGYTTQGDWSAVADQIGRGKQIRTVLPLLDPTFGEQTLYRDLTAGTDAGGADFVIELDTRHLRWHCAGRRHPGGKPMNLLPMPVPIRRALTIDEMTVILARITAVEDLTQLLPIVVTTVYDTLLADLGLSLNTLPKGQQLDPRKFLIPAQQWEAISTAVTTRATVAGGRPAPAMSLVDLLPSTYDDPAAPVPDRRAPTTHRTACRCR